MALDQNLFTLFILPSKNEPDVINLADPGDILHYTKRRNPPTQDAAYSWSLYEPLSGGLLSTVTAPSAGSKQKRIALHNPDAMLDFKFTGTLSFKWAFDWEEHTFEWRREACYMLRRPDPPVQVAVTREASERNNRAQSVQILDYNLNRFDIADRKGLEICILTALLTFQDINDERAERHAAQASEAAPPAPAAGSPTQSAVPSASVSPQPPLPPVPDKAPAVLIARAQAQWNLELNEILVEEFVVVEEYAKFGCNLLNDDSMLYIMLRSGGPEQVPKVIAVAEGVKRLRHKAGVEETLHTYTSYEEMEKKKGPRVINLNDPSSSSPASNAANYTPPMTLTMHLSKIPMPELQPKAKAKLQPRGSAASDNEDTLRPSGSHSRATTGYVSDNPPKHLSKPGKPPKHKKKPSKSPPSSPFPGFPQPDVPASYGQSAAAGPHNHSRPSPGPAFAPPTGYRPPGPYLAPPGPPPSHPPNKAPGLFDSIFGR